MGDCDAGRVMTDIIQRYNSLDELFTFLRQHRRNYVPEHRRDYFFGLGTPAAMEYCTYGAPERECEHTRKLMEKVDATAHDRKQRGYIQSPAGSFPVVPEYLMGQPLHMRRREHLPMETAPVRVVVETLVSVGVTPEQIARRGAAVSALVMRLSETRPVELWAAWGMQPHQKYSRNDPSVIGRVKLDTAPISISHIVAVLNSRAFARAITFANAFAACGLPHNEYGVKWAWNESPTSPRRIHRMRKVMELDDADIFIPGGYLDESDLFMRDPVAWVNKYVDEQRTLDHD